MKTRGFTLIELLVVIAIIGILSSVILASLNSAREKAKDAKVRSDLHEVSTALQFYYDKHGSYPPNPQPCCSLPIATALAPLVTEGFIPALPTSPNSYGYYYYDYGGTVGGLIGGMFTGTAPSTGYPGSCRPFAAGTNWCDQASDTFYCLCNPY